MGQINNNTCEGCELLVDAINMRVYFFFIHVCFLRGKVVAAEDVGEIRNWGENTARNKSLSEIVCVCVCMCSSQLHTW